MLKNIFSVEKNNMHKVVNILGIKFKIFNGKSILPFVNNLRQNQQFFPMRNLFFFSNLKKLSKEQKNWYLSQRIYKATGYFPNLKHPKTFNEKLNWMKLNCYDPNQKNAIDKYEFKNYIKERLGEGYTIPLIGVYSDVNDIDFDSLPDKFVIKTTTGWGGKGVEIVKDKSKLDIDYIKAHFNNLIQQWNSYYYVSLPAGYKEITPRIIIEQYMEQLGSNCLYDYKVHCFHGEPKLILGIKNRKNGKYKYRFYTPEWEPLDLYRESRNDLADFEKPQNYDKMLEFSKILSKDFPFVRVDFYEVDGKLYVGELTFTPKGGFGKYSPIEWDYKIGEWLDLGKINPEHLQILPEFAEAAKTFIDPQTVENHTIICKNNLLV